MADAALSWLMDWYARHCDGVWEHGHGISIDTIDNPGWSLKVDLMGTYLEGTVFEETRRSYNDDISWSICHVQDNIFHAACGPRDLISVLATFRQWAESNKKLAG